MQQPMQQQEEQMDAGGRTKRAPPAPLSGDSPSTPRAKRVLLPDGPPPPSLPPSPPSPNGGKQPPGPPSPNQTGEGVRRAGSPTATDARAGSSRRLDFSAAGRACLCGAIRGPLDGTYSPRRKVLKFVECKCNYASDSEPESRSEEESCVSACSDSGDDPGGPGPRAEPERPNTKGYLKCEACDHWLPWLWDKKNSLCARCSGNRELRAWFDRELA